MSEDNIKITVAVSGTTYHRAVDTILTQDLANLLIELAEVQKWLALEIEQRSRRPYGCDVCGSLGGHYPGCPVPKRKKVTARQEEEGDAKH